MKGKRFVLGVCVAGMLMGMGSATTSVQAGWGDVLKVGVGATLYYRQLNEEIHYLDNEGRGDMFKSLKKEMGGEADNWQNRQQLSQIVERVSAVAARTEPSVKEKPFQYFVNPNTEFNAACTLGHNLTVNTGIFDILNHHTDEIAIVVAHEMAHGIKNHSVSSAKKGFTVQVLQAIYAAKNPNTASLVGDYVVGNAIKAKGITMGQEKEADNLAFTYTSQAGYNIGAGAAVWQRFMDKYDKHKASFVGELFAPSDHPSNEWRRDNYAKKIEEYSKKTVKVDAKSGMIFVNNKTFLVPVAVGDMSEKERAYLIAGNLAAVYHNNAVIPAAELKGRYVYMGVQPIMMVTAGENGSKIVDDLNAVK